MNSLKIFIIKILNTPFKILFLLFILIEKLLIKLPFPSSYLLAGRQFFTNSFENDTRKIVNTSNGSKVNFVLHTPNKLCLYRQETFFTKEPEMLEWIEKYGGEGAFYDIGANIGIYSIYFAKAKQGKVYSFEPSVFNLKQLAKNISINMLSNQITVIPNPLSDNTGIASFINSNTDEGGALNAFGVDYGHTGEKIENKVEYSILGFSLDDMLSKGIITEPPAIIKIDVDGIEHLILSGAKKTISADSCKSIYVEVNDNFLELAEKVKKILEDAGFSLIEKRQYSKKLGPIFNQIWVKK